MGTRHLICVFWKGKWHIAQYGQWDGYPEGQGLKILKFLSVAHNIDKLKVGLEHIYVPTKEELSAIWDECEAWDENWRATNRMWQPKMTGIEQLYPSLSREASAGLLSIIARASLTADDEEVTPDDEKEATPHNKEEAVAENGAKSQDEPKKIPVVLKLDFANDTLFCEWAYVIDLDKEVFEVYGGGERKHDGHRFKDVGPEDAPVPAFVRSFPFSELYLMKSNKEFLDKIKEALPKGEDEDEEQSDGEEEGSDKEEEEDEEDEEGEEGEKGEEGNEVEGSDDKEKVFGGRDVD